MYETIKNMLISKKTDIDELSLKYFTNYFTVVATRNIIPENMNIDELMDNVLRMGKIEFFKNDAPIAKKHGNDFKGKRDTNARVLYVRESLSEELKEMVIYHEIHHAAQTNEEMLKSKDEPCGINQNINLGRMIMEAQTEWFAEEVYKTVHNCQFEEREILSENLRMQANQTVTSSLHNYEMYGALLKKLAILMDVSEDYFVKINYMYKDNKGLKKLEADYENVRIKKELPLSFKGIMQILDYVYIVDNVAYVKQHNHDLVLSGGETEEAYQVHENFKSKISQKRQADYLTIFDRENILALMKSPSHLEPDSDFIRYAKYIFNNQNRELINEYISNNARIEKKEQAVNTGPKR